METLKLFTKAQVEEIAKIFKSEKMTTFAADIKAKAAANPEQYGAFKMIVSTEDKDRSGDIVKADGWVLDNYKNNPIVLWAHDYCGLPIGVTTSIAVEGTNVVAEGYFAPEEANPFAQQVRKLYDLGIVKTASVGFIPLEFDPQNDDVITKQELLEWSFVPVPANANALNLLKEAKLEVGEFISKGFMTKDEGDEEDIEEEAAPVEGDACVMEDGTDGVMGVDDNGDLVCMLPPTEESEEGEEEKAITKGTNLENFQVKIADLLSKLSIELSNKITDTFSVISKELSLFAPENTHEQKAAIDQFKVKMVVEQIEQLSKKSLELKDVLESALEVETKTEDQKEVIDLGKNAQETDNAKVLKLIATVCNKALENYKANNNS